MTATQFTEPYRLCAQVSRENGEEPIGSAVTFEQCLLIELPLPWPRDAMQAPNLPSGVLDVLARAEERGLKARPQAIIPDAEYSEPGHTRIIHYAQPADFLTRFRKEEYVLPAEKVKSLIEALIEQPQLLPAFAAYRRQTEDVREILVCTHGTRDTCCGTLGVPIYQRLRHNFAPASNGRLRVWRTSHTGGHRFAPTLIDFPDGHYWGRVELEMLDVLLHRAGPVSQLREFYRGWSALSHLEQVVEREAWQAEGWAWLDYRKTSQLRIVDEADSRAEVALSFTGPDGQSGSYRAIVEQRGSVMTLPSSGSGPLREEPLYQVLNLKREQV
jgi:hypothetical protein